MTLGCLSCFILYLSYFWKDTAVVSQRCRSSFLKFCFYISTKLKKTNFHQNFERTTTQPYLNLLTLIPNINFNFSTSILALFFYFSDFYYDDYFIYLSSFHSFCSNIKSSLHTVYSDQDPFDSFTELISKSNFSCFPKSEEQKLD